jgi:hypothetical protein
MTIDRTDRSSVSHRTPVSYIDKSREFYAAQGYLTPYRWAAHADTPFAEVRRPLGDTTVAVVTTAFPEGVGAPKRVYAQACEPFPDSMTTDDLSWDKDATHTDDIGTFLPLHHLHALATDGVIGRLGPRFYGVPTEYSRRRTAQDALRVEHWAREDEVDLVVLIPL